MCYFDSLKREKSGSVTAIQPKNKEAYSFDISTYKDKQIKLPEWVKIPLA